MRCACGLTPTSLPFTSTSSDEARPRAYGRSQGELKLDDGSANRPQGALFFLSWHREPPRSAAAAGPRCVQRGEACWRLAGHTILGPDHVPCFGLRAQAGNCRSSDQPVIFCQRVKIFAEPVDGTDFMSYIYRPESSVHPGSGGNPGQVLDGPLHPSR